MRIPLRRFLRAHSLVSIERLSSSVSHWVYPIERILSSAFNQGHSIVQMRILSCGFHRTSSIVWIPSGEFHRASSPFRPFWRTECHNLITWLLVERLRGLAKSPRDQCNPNICEIQYLSSNHKKIIVFVLSPSIIFVFFRLITSATWLCKNSRAKKVNQKIGNNIKVCSTVLFPAKTRKCQPYKGYISTK